MYEFDNAPRQLHASTLVVLEVFLKLEMLFTIDLKVFQAWTLETGRIKQFENLKIYEFDNAPRPLHASTLAVLANYLKRKKNCLRLF